jgi:hypothetical protein
MKQADPAELKCRIEAIIKASPLGSRVTHVDVEPDEDGEGGSFLRVSLQLEHPETLNWDEVEPLISSIEESVAAVDERFPSVRFADAA